MAGSSSPVLESIQFGEEIQRLMMTVPFESATSFTALLELPVNQAMEALHSSDSRDGVPHKLSFPSNMALVERAAKFSVFAGENNSSGTSLPVSNLSVNVEKVKNEPMDTDSNPTLLNPPVENNSHRLAKRKEREKKGKGSSKKSKNEGFEDAEKLPYVHVRARRGQATDSHSLAERARREKINARMKLLQELVPGCNKISGTALMLDEIINHVQSLQRQVEFLSMRLAAVDPRIDFNLENILAAEFVSMRLAAVNPIIDFSLENILSSESGSLMDSNFPTMAMPPAWQEFQVNGNKQHYQQQWHFDAVHQPLWGREEDNHNFLAPENSLLSYDSSNSASMHSNLLKMEL